MLAVHFKFRRARLSEVKKYEKIKNTKYRNNKSAEPKIELDIFPLASRTDIELLIIILSCQDCRLNVHLRDHLMN